MSDINKVVSNTKIVSFADDTRVYNNTYTVDDCNVLQSDLESVYIHARVQEYWAKLMPLQILQGEYNHERPRGGGKNRRSPL